MRNKYKTLIISCWIVLIICFLIKMLDLCNFNIICNNDNFALLCNWIDSSWMIYLIATIVYVPSAYLMYLCFTKQKLFDDWWIILLLLPNALLKNKVAILGWMIDLSVLIIIPLIKAKFKNWLYVIFGNVLIVAFQFISLLTKNININLTNEPTLIALIMQIDYYIMIVLYYLYVQYYRKELN